MPDLNDFHAFQSTSSESNGNGGGGGGGGGNFGCGWVVIIVVIFMLIFFIADGASWDAIDSLLGMGFLAFLFFRWIST